MGIATLGPIETRQSLRDESWPGAGLHPLTLDLTSPPPAPPPPSRHLRRPAVAAVAVALAASAWATHAAGQRGPSAPPRPAALPQPAGTVETLYRFTVESGPAEVVTFFDTAGRWCRATWFDHEPRAGSHYQCRTTNLPAEGFGRVDSVREMPTWDGVRLWMQGIVTDDIARVTVTYRNGSVATAQMLSEPLMPGVLFTVARPYFSAPMALRAYDAYGALVQTFPILGRPPTPWSTVP